MKVKLKVNRACFENGVAFAQSAGEVIDVPDIEAGRLIRAGQADAGKPEDAKVALDAADAAGKPYGRHYSASELKRRGQQVRNMEPSPAATDADKPKLKPVKG